jgi:hypothetical protein
MDLLHSDVCLVRFSALFFPNEFPRFLRIFLGPFPFRLFRDCRSWDCQCLCSFPLIPPSVSDSGSDLRSGGVGCWERLHLL